MTGFRSLVRADFAAIRNRDPAARGPVETALTYPGLHALFSHRIAHGLWQRGWRGTARVLSYLARMATGIDIHPAARIGPGLFIDHGAGVVIGETAEIGEGVTLYHGVTLGGTSWSPGKRHPTLGDGVMVGAGAKILGPITVEAGARVGANSVVVESVPAEATVVGIPARIVRTDRPRTGQGGRVDLDHHLVPDPVGRALAQLADRVAFLEARLAARDPARPAPSPACGEGAAPAPQTPPYSHRPN
ncbi:serine O-acetyltransferase [Pseudooceanicola nanhaiensis]|uniref:serine O-acetyltransferase n=1 Tax=Pseudooceanicola nanhaiensis TaxID=375761 RepID=UPI001CD24BB5|nr:serine O-acetyltransferase [Pseudooceanicola nanhaiensis]MCA0920169.1 serine O-acetyltransferase [Pseudooceanicola nanhaiensis]